MDDVRSGAPHQMGASGDRPEYLLLGHVTRDLTAEGVALGGTSSYAARTARRLGKRTAVLTSFGPDVPPLAALEGVVIRNLPDPGTTTFENVYREGDRQQRWLASARPLTFEAVPQQWRSAQIVHFAPVAQELSPSLAGRFSGGLICATGQGWLRGKDPADRVIFQVHPVLMEALPSFDVFVLSREDVPGEKEALIRMLSAARLGVETRGHEGCRLYHGAEVHDVPVEMEPEVDVTGAGDVFAAAFFIRYQETGDPILAARFANACASLSVRDAGLFSIPTRSQVEARAVMMYSTGAAP